MTWRRCKPRIRKGSSTSTPADHGFNCDQRGSYDAPSAALARKRTLEFFAQHLAAEKPKGEPILPESRTGAST